MSHYVQPDFIIIGAMKSATSTLYQQLVLQSGIYMPELKEPNFFSDDDQYQKGHEWYSSLFSPARASEICGEASTHYTKLPTYPDTINRLKEYVKKPRLVYVMREPISRLVSHYSHEWSENNIQCDINQAVYENADLIDYGRYHYQLQPFIKAFGRACILPVFFERLIKEPQTELERICEFIGYPEPPKWELDLPPDNVSKLRIRKFPMYDLLVNNRAAESLRRALVPQTVRTLIKNQFRQKKKPALGEDTISFLREIYNSDLTQLGYLLDVDLNCENYIETVSEATLTWSGKFDE